jgi:hypothetical protein
MLIPFGVLSAAGAEVGVAGSYELIASEILGSAQSSITFSNLGDYSSTYKHLQIRYVARSTASFAAEEIALRFNDISTASYSRHRLFGTGSSVVSGNNTSQTKIDIGFIQAATATANAFGAGVIDILDAYSTTKNKTFRSLNGTTQGETYIALYSGAFLATTALTSLVLRSTASVNFVAGSRFSLYGIKG